MRTIIEATAVAELAKTFERYPEQSQQAIRMAINDIAKGKGMKLIRTSMMAEVAFPGSYLNGDRLQITQRATNSNPQAVITARKRATSLARFASGTPSSTAKKGVTVRVKKGKSVHLKSGWLVRLRAGASMSEDNYNIGLAVRLGPGEKLANKTTTHTSWLVKGSVALLYGPSVNQVFSTVAEDVSRPIGEMVTTEYLRQMARLLE